MCNKSSKYLSVRLFFLHLPVRVTAYPSFHQNWCEWSPGYWQSSSHNLMFSILKLFPLLSLTSHSQHNICYWYESYLKSLVLVNANSCCLEHQLFWNAVRLGVFACTDACSHCADLSHGALSLFTCALKPTI